MNTAKLVVATLFGLLVGAQSAFAAEILPVEDGGLFVVAAVGVVAAIKIARWKQKR